jgi:tripartite-type tricarboxylate transporter receptor subunit TctC
MIRRRLLLAAPAALALPRPAAAQAFPQRQIRIVVPFTPGGSPDVVARIIADEATRRWPAGTVAENRAGAGGNLAAEHVARAAPDGHTLLLMSNNIVAVNPHVGRMPIDPLTELVPIALLARAPLVIVVNPDQPVRDLAGLVEMAKARPGAVTYASAGVGSPHHLAMALLAHMTGVQMTHVPYRGTAPALTDVVAGRITAMATPYGTALPMIQDRRVRPLAAAGARRIGGLPDLPTAAETGIAGYETDTWLALAAPRGTPAPVISALESLSLETMATPRSRETLERQGIELDAQDAAALGALMRRDHERWGAVIRAAGIREE